MSKIAIVYWSGTGNTEAMANLVAEGVAAAGGQADLLTPELFDAGQVDQYAAFAFGCPSMGAEQLEEAEFEPMFTAVKPRLAGKTVGLFGSYGWGDGQWMRDWWDRAERDGAKLYGGEGLIINETPDDAGLEQCRAFGSGFAAF